MKKNEYDNAMNEIFDRAEHKPVKQDIQNIQDIHDKQYINDIQNIQDIQKRPAEWKKILVRFSKEEYDYISQKAWENHLDINKYLRKIIDDDMKKERG